MDDPAGGRPGRIVTVADRAGRDKAPEHLLIEPRRHREEAAPDGVPMSAGGAVRGR
jgi:hypothetical protein